MLENDELKLKLQEATEKTIKQQEQLKDLQLKYDKAVEEFSSDLQQSTTELQDFKLKFNELKSQYDEAVRDNNFMKSKLRFLEKNPHIDSNSLAGLNNCDTQSLHMPPTFTIDHAESFDNTHLAELKRGFTVDDLQNAGALQKRNSQYPPHMKDSYAIGSLDKDMDEHEMKFGTLPNELKHRKLRPSSIPTPSKYSRASITASSTPNEPSVKPNRVINFLSSLAKGKDEVSSNFFLRNLEIFVDFQIVNFAVKNAFFELI